MPSQPDLLRVVRPAYYHIIHEMSGFSSGSFAGSFTGSASMIIPIC
jgi:hypothetical protein